MESVEQLRAWIGRTVEAEDIVTQRLVDGYRATLDPYLAVVAADQAPLGLHWCLAPPAAPMAELAPDGHRAKGLLLPLVALPRRMWAGGEVESLLPLEIGARVRRKSIIADIAFKQGRSGALCFVTVRHELETSAGLAIRERHDIVYREAASAKAAKPAPAPEPRRQATHSWSVTPTPVMLFRYSALTFNGHRIHYDHPYATGVEGYPGLVVHGPLQATLLFNLAATVGRKVPPYFRYRALAPLTGEGAFNACAAGSDGGIECWTESMPGQVHMLAEAQVAGRRDRAG
jgi:3-methylfumaryl-CoA hydratase